MDKILLAGCVIRDKSGALLLLHRQTDKHDQWEIPGGKVDEGEVPVQTAERELLEELSLRVAVGQELGRASFDDAGRSFEYVWFAATTKDEPKIAEPEFFCEWRYVPLEDVLQQRLQLSGGARMLVSLVKSGRITI